MLRWALIHIAFILLWALAAPSDLRPRDILNSVELAFVDTNWQQHLSLTSSDIYNIAKDASETGQYAEAFFSFSFSR